MPKEWTPERRAAQAERIRAAKPWLKSTGPRTKAGKKRSSMNALKHGNDSHWMRNARKAIRLSRESRLLVCAVIAAQEPPQGLHRRPTNCMDNPMPPDSYIFDAFFGPGELNGKIS